MSMALLSRKTPNPPDAHAIVHRNSSAMFSLLKASLNESPNFLLMPISPFFWDAILAALVAAAANGGKDISPKNVANPSLSSAAPTNTAAIAVALIKISAMIVVATNLLTVAPK